MTTSPPAADAGPTPRYQGTCAASLNAEAHLDTVSAVRQVTLWALKRGASLTTSLKEGGSNSLWRHGGFACSDDGDDPSDPAVRER